jgi:hypothetical protein
VVLGAAVVALTVIVGVLAIAVANRHLNMQWGTPFDAFAAVGTVGALGVALWVFFHSERVRRSDERSEQAELITGWLADHYTSDWSNLNTTDHDVHHSIGLTLSNVSEIVVYDVLVVVTCAHVDPPFECVDGWDHKFIPDPCEFQPLSDRLARARFAVLRSGQWEMHILLAHASVKAVDLDIFFRDHRGVYWRRSMRGGLTEVTIPRSHAGDPDAIVRAAERELGPSTAEIEEINFNHLRSP